MRASITHADQHRQGRGGVGAQWTEKVPHFLLHLSYKLLPLCPNLHMCGSVKLHKLLINQVRYSVPKRSTEIPSAPVEHGRVAAQPQPGLAAGMLGPVVHWWDSRLAESITAGLTGRAAA